IWTLNDSYASQLGNDYIAANGSISLVRTTWWINASNATYLANGWPGTYVAGTCELYPTESWGTNYVVPISTPYTQLIVQAQEDNTVVNAASTTPATVTLSRGRCQVYTNVPLGATVTSDKPIQAAIMTNRELGGGYGWDTRHFTLSPWDLLGNDYYIPVPGFTTWNSSDGVGIHGTAYVPTNLTIYAFNDSTQVQIETGGGTTPVLLNAGDTYNYTMPRIASYYPITDPMTGGYAAHIYANDTIWVLGSGDDNDDDFDWGFQGINTSLLGAEYYIPWSPANPAYVTPIANATFHVDLNADGTEEYQFNLNRLSMRMIYPNDTVYRVDPLNLTGAKIWTNDAVPFAIHWGQDNNEDTPGERSVGDPDNDFGYTVLYVPVFEAPEPGTWDGYVYEDPNCNCTYDQDEIGVPNVTVWLYNATTDGLVNTTTTDGSGYYLFTNVTPGPYRAIYNVSDLPLNLSQKCDDDTPITGSEVDKVTSDDNLVLEDGTHRHNFAVESTADIDIEKLVDGFGMERVEHNQNITYTLTITNTGDVNLTNITVVDLLPADITWADAADPVEDSVINNANGTTTIVWQRNLTGFEPLQPEDFFVICFNATVNESAAYTVLHKDWATVNATSDWGDVTDRDHADVFIDPPRVPVLTPFGIVALIGLLSLVAIYSMSKGVRRKRE
ncbi:MAG: carboxypeptidase regulatory-like domain-containing protein, partial [Methanosarcinales archaeon]|nr:carboxypeptidase regulatory-like domain-containing protein [Methanosarcinales archaeon]